MASISASLYRRSSAAVVVAWRWSDRSSEDGVEVAELTEEARNAGAVPTGVAGGFGEGVLSLIGWA